MKSLWVIEKKRTRESELRTNALIMGQRVKVSYQDQTVTGEILLVSPNEKSVMVKLDSSLWIGKGFYLCLPLLRKDDGKYHDLFFGKVIEMKEQLLD